MRPLIRLMIGLVLAGLLLPGSAEARRVALVIGNGAYRHADALLNPVNDATAISQALERLNFDRVTLHSNLDAEPLRKALLAFEAEANDAEIALVFFAGHGIEVDGQNYLVPTDARFKTSGAVEVEAVSLSTVTAMLAGVRGLRLVILDACRNNPFRPVMLADASRKKRAIGRGLRAVEPVDNELIAFAAAAGTEAADGDGGHSPFTMALLNNIERPGLEIGQLFRVVRDEVMKSTGREQTPHFYGSLGSELIFLSPVTSAAAPGGQTSAAVREAARLQAATAGNFPDTAERPPTFVQGAKQKAEHALLVAEAARRNAEHRQNAPPPRQAPPQRPEIGQTEINRIAELPAPPASDDKRQPAGRCESLQGAWLWQGRYLAMDVNFKSDGSGATQSGIVGKWTCANGRYRIAWLNGFTDSMVLSPDGRRLSGTSYFGNPISASRK